MAWQSLAASPKNFGTGGDLLNLLAAISGEAEKLKRHDITGIVHALKQELGSSTKPGPESLERCRAELDRLRCRVPASEDMNAAQPEDDLASDPELLNDFILESQDYLASVETHLLAIERNPDESESIHAVFRSFHTIKGLAGFLGFSPIQSVAHEIENVLDRAREGKLSMTPTIIDMVLRAADYLKDCIALLSDPGAQVRSASGFPPNTKLLAAIRGLDGSAVVSEPAREERGEEIDKPKSEETGATRASGATSTVKVDTSKMEYLVDMIGELVIAQSIVRHDPVLAAGDNRLCLAILPSWPE